jgi:asparagine synthase (glutamine-hydrolysing)
MAHSLEVRCPLLDHRIIEFAARLPSALKMNAGEGKLPLRRLAAKRLPAGSASLPKRGFSIPAAKWLRGELRPMAEDLLFSGRDALAQIVDGSVLRRMWHEHLTGTRDHNVLLWGLMMLELWQRTSRASCRPSIVEGPYEVALRA